MTELEGLELLDRRARELAVAAQALSRYETAIEASGSAPNPEIFGALRHDVWEAEVALHAVIAAQEDTRLASLSAAGIQQIRYEAQEQAIASVAAAQGWEWQADSERWRTPQGLYYSRIGELLSNG